MSILNLRGVVILFMVLLLLGVAAADDEEWNVAPLSDTSEGNADYPTFGSGNTDESALFMTSGPVEGFDSTQGGSGELSQYSQYFSMEAPTSGGEVERYYISGHEPSRIYTGGQSRQTLAYSTYQSMYGGANALWIQGATSWAQYIACPLNAYLQLLAYSSSGGTADFYEIYPDNRVLYKSYRFYPGYSRLTFHADTVGRHILLFVANNQPSNVAIVDVMSGIWPPWPSGLGPMPGYAEITIKSNWLRGYSVTVDGSYKGTDGQGSDAWDGIYSFIVAGNQYHNIRIASGGYTNIKGRTFNSGYHYTLNI
ncbi:MAG: hypothetical protein ACXQT4_00165 [Methanotrichaceae archaeon]